MDDSCVNSSNFIHLSHASHEHTNQSKPVAGQFRVMTLWQINLLPRNVKKFQITVYCICSECMLTVDKHFDAFPCPEIRTKKH